MLNFHQNFQKICKENISQTFLIANQKHDSLTTFDKRRNRKNQLTFFRLKLQKLCFRMIHSIFSDPKKKKKLNALDYKIVAIFVNRDFLFLHLKIRLTIVCTNHNFFIRVLSKSRFIAGNIMWNLRQGRVAC